LRTKLSDREDFGALNPLNRIGSLNLATLSPATNPNLEISYD